MTDEIINVVSCGYTILQDDKLGVKFVLYNPENDSIDFNTSFAFSKKKHNNYPVGWIVTMKQHQDGQYSSFSSTGKIIKDDRMKNIIVESVTNKKYVEYIIEKEKMNKFSEQLDNLKIKEIKELVKNKKISRDMIRLYLLEIF